MKATLEFFVDKPLEHRRMKMAIEAEQAFAVIVALTDYGKHKRAYFESVGDTESADIYKNILSCLDEFLNTNEITLENFKEIELLIRRKPNEVEIKQSKNGMGIGRI